MQTRCFHITSSYQELLFKDLIYLRDCIIKLNCPKNEEVWLHAIRLFPLELKNDICVKAIYELPNKSSIWLKAIELEMNINEKIKIIKKSLEYIPNSLEIWKKYI